MFRSASVALLLVSSLCSADRAILGYDSGGPYSGPVIVYTYITSDGRIALSHCRAPASVNFGHVFSSYTSLNLNTCDLSYQPPVIRVHEQPSVQVSPPTPLAF